MSALVPSGLVPLGRVVKAHGIRGEVRVKRYHAASTALREARVIVLGEREIGVHSARDVGDADLLVLDGVSTREAAEALIGLEVAVPRAALPPPAADEAYLVDLIGLDAVEGERSLGRVAGVATHPASSCAILESEAGTREVPLVPPYLVAIDLAARRLVLAHVDDFEVVRHEKKR